MNSTATLAGDGEAPARELRSALGWWGQPVPGPGANERPLGREEPRGRPSSVRRVSHQWERTDS